MSIDAAAAPVRFVAIGDSFTEGVGDERSDGHVRGWADLAAQGWATALGEPIAYANLAIRGKLIEPIVREQLETALALKPTHLSFNGGGNDMMRPRADLVRIMSSVAHVVERCGQEGVQLIALTGANPCARLPLGTFIEQRGDQLAHALEERFGLQPGVITSHNWFDTTLGEERFWTQDRLHMNARGHHRVAARMLAKLGVTVPEAWWDLDELDVAIDAPLRGAAYYRTHVGPWVKRRLTGTSSGDGRVAKFGSWSMVAPARVSAELHDAR